MPDSQLPPLWGPAYDERDLDALLSGLAGRAGTPAALQPVESTLTALRAPATGRELALEAAARAAFRALAPIPAPPVAPTTPQPAVLPPPMVFAPPPPPPPPPPALWGHEVPSTLPPPAEYPAVAAHTLILPAPGDRTQPPARGRHGHRGRRAPGGGPRKTNLALTGAAAAVLVVVAVAAAGAVTGSIPALRGHGPHASAAAPQPGQSRGSQRVLGSASPTPKARATTMHADPVSSASSASSSPQATPDPGTLCRQYWADLMHPIPGGAAAETALRRELEALAGGRHEIFGYCFRELAEAGGKTALPPPDGGRGYQWPGDPGTGGPDGGAQPTPSGGPGVPGGSDGSGGSGTGGWPGPETGGADGASGPGGSAAGR